MGGAVFASDGIDTPRITSATYEQALAQVEHQLQDLFKIAIHAIAAPEKQDHGDLDLLVLALPDARPDIDTIAQKINAVTYKIADFTNGIYHFAIPWPAHINDKLSGNQLNGVTDGPNTQRELSSQEELGLTDQKPIYIQVDLTICQTEDELQWRLFAYSHGDAMNILGSIVRHKGFTLTNQALYLRLGLDTNNKKLNRVELTRNSAEVLDFLGMDRDTFWTAFDTKDALMTYISTCRFFSPSLCLGTTEERRLELDKRALDKSRIEFRPLFQYWYKTWLPQHTTQAPSKDAHMTSAEASELAFEYFGDDIRNLFNTKHKELSTILAKDKLWIDVKTMLVEGKHLSGADLHDTLRALRKNIIPVASAEPEDAGLLALHRAYLAQAFDTILEWTFAHHDSVLQQWRADIAQRQLQPTSVDERKACKYSTSAIETYSSEDDALIIELKAKDWSWNDILIALGKKSKSQLQAHWKQVLQHHQQLPAA